MDLINIPHQSTPHDNAVRVAIVGSRKYPRLGLVRDFVQSLPVGSVIISGGAPGVDQAAEDAAKSTGLELIVFPADWDGLGRKAGPIRNSQIVEAADRLVAFWDGISRGTQDSIRKAELRGIPVIVFNNDGQIISTGNSK